MSRMPAIFFGHGNPMNAIEDNVYSRTWAALGRALPKPKAILCVSAHWYLPATLVTAVETPRTIHDFGGFPRPLYEVQYPAPGDLALCKRVAGADGRAVRRSVGTRSRHVVGARACLPRCERSRWCSSASTKRSRRSFITRSEENSRRCAMKRSSSSAAETSCTTCTRFRGAAIRSSRSTGRCASRPARGSGSRPEITRRSSGTRSSGATRCCPRRRPITTSPSSTSSARDARTTKVSFPVEGVDGGSVSMLSVMFGNAGVSPAGPAPSRRRGGEDAA